MYKHGTDFVVITKGRAVDIAEKIFLKIMEVVQKMQFFTGTAFFLYSSSQPSPQFN